MTSYPQKIGPAAAAEYDTSASCWMWLIKRFPILWKLWIPYFKWRYKRYIKWYDRQPKYEI